MFRILLPVSEGLWLQVRDGCSSCWTHFLPTQFTILARSFRYWNIRVFCVMSIEMERLQNLHTVPIFIKIMEITPPNCPALSMRKLS